MNHELPSYAYDLEGHAITVLQEEKLGKLVLTPHIIGQKPSTIDEYGSLWVKMDNASFFAGHCDVSKFTQLEEGSIVTLIQSPGSRYEWAFERFNNPIAAVIDNDTALYVCPVFDYKALLQRLIEERRERDFE